MKEKNASEAVFISNRKYSDRSKIYALGVGITLIGFDEIVGAMKELNPSFTMQPTWLQRLIIQLDLKRFYRREFLPKMRELRNMAIALPVVLLLGYAMMHVLLFLLPIWSRLMISTLPHISQ